MRKNHFMFLLYAVLIVLVCMYIHKKFSIERFTTEDGKPAQVFVLSTGTDELEKRVSTLEKQMEEIQKNIKETEDIASQPV